MAKNKPYIPQPPKNKMAKTATTGNKGFSIMKLLPQLKPLDLGEWRKQFGEQQKSYDLKDTRPRYDQPQQRYSQAGSDRQILYPKQSTNIRERKPITYLSLMQQNYRFN